MSGLLDVAKDVAGSTASNKISFPHLQKTLFDGTFAISGESLTGIYHGFHISIVWLDRHTFTPQYVVTINASNPNDPENNNLKCCLVFYLPHWFYICHRRHCYSLFCIQRM